MITFAQTLTAPEIDSTAMMETSDRVDPTLLEQVDFVPGAHVAVGKQNVAWTQEIPQPAQHTQLAVALARIAADCQVEYGSAGERKEGRDACQRKTKSWLLLRRLRIGLLVLRSIWHRYGRAIVGQDATTFPKPLLLGAVIQRLVQLYVLRLQKTPREVASSLGNKRRFLLSRDVALVRRDEQSSEQRPHDRNDPGSTLAPGRSTA